jgi:hypothetical protein
LSGKLPVSGEHAALRIGLGGKSKSIKELQPELIDNLHRRIKRARQVLKA